jgi:hypothetical protein
MTTIAEEEMVELTSEEITETMVAAGHEQAAKYCIRAEDFMLRAIYTAMRAAAPTRTPPVDAAILTECVEAQIKHMVSRFLMWRLPDDFHPDAGISFEPEFNVEYMAARGQPPMRHTPVGTNLLNADQAEKMVRYMLEGFAA